MAGVTPAAQTSQRRPRHRGWWICLTLLGMAFLVEGAARGIVWWKWDREQIDMLTQHSAVHGKFTAHAYLPYVLAPNYQDHNSLGFRGREISPKKPAGTRRIVCVGGSTTYGIFVNRNETCAAQLESLLRADGLPVEVINAGVPGWVSSEILVDLALRILPLEPDLVVFYEGRNELLPQSFNGYTADYSHFRRSDYNIAATNYLPKQLFRWSYVYMLAATTRTRGRLGWSWRDEHPVYGCIRYENCPTSDQVIANLADPSRSLAFEHNVTEMVGLCQSRGVKVLLCTMAFIPRKFASGVIASDPRICDPLESQLNRNNDALRRIARRMHTGLAETAALAAQPELFVDDCHCRKDGHARRAAIMHDAILKDANLLSTLQAGPTSSPAENR